MRTIFAAVVAVLCALPARAGVTAGVDQTLGTAGYRGTKVRASVDIGDAFYLAPSFSTYRSDASSGSYRTFALRAGYETGPLAFGVEAAVQPKTNGYKREEIGGDATFSLTPGGSAHGRKMAGPSSGGTETFGAGLAAVDVGAGLNFIRHSDDLQAAPAGGVSGMRSRRPAVARATTLTFGQTDVSVFGGLRFLVAEASVELTKSAYSKNLDAVNARESQFLQLSGVDSIAQGFPDTSANARLTWKSLPLVKPYVSYTHTTFKLGAAPSNAYAVGAKAGFEMITVKAGYERYAQKGFADQNFYTLGAGLNF
ncbi:MAG: hypothetical protein PHS14_13560 [Elusimicrobia bacterium]|nr:hypothetical protein [Elusimicrobiota bacterium]